MAKRRGHGEGSIYQRKDGLWVGVVDRGWEDGKRKRKVVYDKTRAEVVTKLRKAQAAVDAGLPLPDERLTVADLIARWLEVKEGTVSPNTIDNYATIARLHIIPVLGKTRVAKLTPSAVQGLLGAKLDDGLSARTVRLIRVVLVQALNAAERWGFVARNVAALTEGPPLRRAAGRSLSVAQAQTLLEAVHGDRHEALYVLLLSLGLRRGEALGLQWGDVDLDAGIMHIERALKRQRGKLVLGNLKTAASRRAIHIPTTLVEALRAHRRRQAAERLEVGPAWRDTDLVYTTSVGTPVDPDNLSKAFARLCERAGLGRWHLHELRHSAASIMLAQGVPLEVVSDVLGHSGIAITKDVYGHVMAAQKKGAADAMGRALWGA